VLDFQRFAVFRWLFGSFSVAFRKLKTFDFQRFANIKQVLDFQQFYASQGCWVGALL